MHIACAPDVVLLDRCGELVGSSMVILLDIYGRCLAWLFLGFGSLQQASTCFTWKANMLDVHLTQEIIQQVTASYLPSYAGRGNKTYSHETEQAANVLHEQSPPANAYLTVP